MASHLPLHRFCAAPPPCLPANDSTHPTGTHAPVCTLTTPTSLAREFTARASTRSASREASPFDSRRDRSAETLRFEQTPLGVQSANPLQHQRVVAAVAATRSDRYHVLHGPPCCPRTHHLHLLSLGTCHIRMHNAGMDTSTHWTRSASAPETQHNPAWLQSADAVSSSIRIAKTSPPPLKAKRCRASAANHALSPAESGGNPLASSKCACPASR